MSDLISKEALIERYAKEYAKNLILYGVNIEEKLETATQLSYALNQAYMRGRQDELDNIARRQVPQWIPCCERLPINDDEVFVT